MPVRITFALDLFNGDSERPESRLALQHMLDCLTAIDADYLRKHVSVPLIYQAGVRYMEEPPGQEDWQDIPTCLAMRIADCEDLACWRAAELQVRHGVMARPFFHEVKRPGGGYLYHILVRHPNGQVEDPSRILGMR